jgi:hypothetical protein
MPFASNPTFCRVMMRGPTDGGERKIPPAEQARRSCPRRAALCPGTTSLSERRAAQQSLWAMLHGVIALRLGNPKYAWSKNLADVALETALRGLVRALPARNGKNGKGSES